jgi:protein TonB
LIKSARPNHPAEAMRAKIQGVVTLDAVVQPDGTVGEVRIKRSLDRKFGLDDAAINSLKDYRFTPGMKDGIPVTMLLSFEVSFTLRK